MSLTYDEVWISTMREINICKDYIKSYEKQIKKLEDKLGIKASDIKEEMLKDKKIKKLYEKTLALKREKERLKGLEELLK
ncbi:hypothetical protein TAGGR_11152 [Thermodesulfovibrio aggregans]|uniref:Uncharacterized protein n=1 Tax=Thermodesulfovibrio aggregans TaxID=86166 RepID=A0A0U9HT54_9BACT|nr:hypothetical protein [Thermodesulfovibrio aggregans]GAQ94954.1 hypothetical protein TAGGR_11152 [Thermodesulfovibrio aggregans]